MGIFQIRNPEEYYREMAYMFRTDRRKTIMSVRLNDFIAKQI